MHPAPVMMVVTSEAAAVKLAPLAAEAERFAPALRPLVVVAAPDPAAVHRSLRLFGIGTAYHLDLGSSRYRYPERAVPSIWQMLGGFFQEHQPAAVVVCGSDPATAAALLAAGFAGIPVARVMSPRPVGLPDAEEEGPAGRVARVLAAAHFCPSAADHGWLVSRGVDYRSAWVTGNPLSDGLADIARQVELVAVRRALGLDPLGPYLVAFLHQVPTGPELVALGRGLRRLAASFGGLLLVFAAGPRAPLRLLAGMLDGCGNLHLLGRPDYPVLVTLLAGAVAAASDSPAVQEVARVTGTPFIPLHTAPEPWLQEAPDSALHRLEEALGDPLRLRDLVLPRNPLDDGRAASRIVRILLRLVQERSAA